MMCNFAKKYQQIVNNFYMKKIYHLASCTTNQRILKELKPEKDFIMQEIKSEPITEKQIDEMAKMAVLFSPAALSKVGNAGPAGEAPKLTLACSVSPPS